MTLTIHQKLILSSVFLIFIVSLYDVLFQFIFELLHVGFESVEELLDLCIEHFFDTGTHETQVIVFYILTAFALLAAFLFYRTLPRQYSNLKKKLDHQKAETLNQWHALPLLQRFEWWLFFVTFVSCFIFFSF